MNDLNILNFPRIAEIQNSVWLIQLLRPIKYIKHKINLNSLQNYDLSCYKFLCVMLYGQREVFAWLSKHYLFAHWHMLIGKCRTPILLLLQIDQILTKAKHMFLTASKNQWFLLFLKFVLCPKWVVSLDNKWYELHEG